MKISDISEEAFNVLISYSRFQKDLRDDIQALQGIEIPEDFMTEKYLLEIRDSNIELTEEQWLEIKSILDVWESLKDMKDTFVEIPDNRPIFYDGEGYAYRLSMDYDGQEYRDYIDMGN